MLSSYKNLVQKKKVSVESYMIWVTEILCTFIYFRTILLSSSHWNFMKIIMPSRTKWHCLLCHCKKMMEFYRGWWANKQQSQNCDCWLVDLVHGPFFHHFICNKTRYYSCWILNLCMLYSWLFRCLVRFVGSHDPSLEIGDSNKVLYSLDNLLCTSLSTVNSSPCYHFCK